MLHDLSKVEPYHWFLPLFCIQF